jgi:ABC-2 type transport system permease protein
MIGVLWRLGWQQLAHDRGALLLTFVLPVAFFSVFAGVFGEFDAGGAPPVAATVVLEDTSPAGAAVAAAIAADAGLDAHPAGATAATTALARGEIAALITIPSGFGAALEAPDARPIVVTIDPSNPVARAGVGGVVQNAAARALASMGQPSSARAASGPAVKVEAAARFARSDASTAFYAAGLGVMFALFSLTMRAATVIEERDNGLVARLAVAGIGVLPLSLARWLYLASVGVLQLGVMFTWAVIVFALRIDALATLAGVVVMIAVSAGAAASFGLLLAELCTTRAQLTAAANTLVLIMSALGGSMVPRFLMPPALVEAGYATLNAWAVDGFRKVLWYDQPIGELAREVTVLIASAATMFALATLAHRARRLR